MSVATEGGPSVPRPGIAFAGVFAVTFCGLFAVGAVLPVLPRYVHGPLDGGNIAVGIVVGSYAITGLLLRPVAGRLADHRGRKSTVLLGSIIVALGGFMYLLPLGVPGLVAARLVLGAGEGAVFTASSAWVVDLAPPSAAGTVDRPLRPLGLGGAQHRAAVRRAAPQRLQLHRGLALRWSGAAAGSRDRHPAARPVPPRPTSRGRASPADRARGDPPRDRPRPRLDRLRHHRRLRRPPPRRTGRRARRHRLRRLRDDGRADAAHRRRPARPGRGRPGRHRRRLGRGHRVGHAGLCPQPPGRTGGCPGDGGGLLAPLPLAVADRGQPRLRDQARRGARYLHRLLRRRDRPRRAPRRPGCRGRQLRGGLPRLGRDRLGLGRDDRLRDQPPRPDADG